MSMQTQPARRQHRQKRSRKAPEVRAVRWKVGNPPRPRSDAFNDPLNPLQARPEAWAHLG